MKGDLRVRLDEPGPNEEYHTPQQRHRSEQSGDTNEDNVAVAPMTERTRRFNILSILPLTSNPTTELNGSRVPIPFRIANEMSGWLAWYHYTNTSSPAVLPHVRERLASCDIDFSYSMRDSQFSALHSAFEFFAAYENSTLRPNALIGAARSITSSGLGYITSAFRIPQISSGSTAKVLDRKEIYSTFARTIATNAGDANAMALYLDHLNVTHVGIIYINDVYGNDFHSYLVAQLSPFNISILSEPYDDFTIDQVIKQVAKSGFRYIIAILNSSNWKSVIRKAKEHNIIGRPDYFWIFESLEFASASFKLDRESEADLANSLHGSAVITVTEQAFVPFDVALSDATQDMDMVSSFISQHDNPNLFSSYSFTLPSRTVYQYFTYDAVTALMLAACETPRNDDFSNISGSRIYEQLLRTEFEGVSGYVAFNSITGTRKADGLVYGVRNIQFPDNLFTGTSINVLSTLTDIVSLGSTSIVSSSFYIKKVAPFYFASNTTAPPLPLPPLNVEMNLIPTPLLAFILSICGFVIFMAIWWIYWTYQNREKDVVKASQPIFLCQIAIGTILISSAVIPLSMQEPVSPHGLDIACMAAPWLLFLGFVTAFAALFMKTWRLNKLFGSSHKLRRVVIRARDVMLPFVVLMVLNVSVLLSWTLHDPLVWDRRAVDENIDKFGRSVESVGFCVGSGTQHAKIYAAILGGINLSVLLFANYQAYMSRNLPSEFSESTYIAIAMGSLLEVAVIGIPLTFVDSSDPSIRYILRSILAIASSLSLLVPIFLPKYFQRNVNRRYHDAVVAATGAAPVRTKVTVTAGSFDIGHPMDNQNDIHDNDDVLATGTVKVRRNTAYIKEKETSLLLKSNHLRRSELSGSIDLKSVREASGSNELNSARESTTRSTSYSSGRDT